jgi:hypothetical protein
MWRALLPPSRRRASRAPVRGWVETQAAYRFFDQASEKKQGLGWEDILTPHLECTVARMRQHRVVLCLQDTTELDFNGQRIEGLGPLSYEAQRGLYLHPTYAVTPDREPLGILDAWIWAREFKDADGNRPGIIESTRWIEGYERVAEAAVRMPDTRLVYLGDRGKRYARADATGTCPGNARRLAASFATQSLPS